MKIGIVMPIAEDREHGRTRPYSAIRALARQAEERGFDSLWVFDHLLFRRPDQPTRGIWEAWTLATALAAITERVEIGTLVLCTAFRNPGLLAKMADTFDEVSGGRLILGLGAGWHQPEFDAFGIPFDHKVDRFEEALQIIGPLLREGQVDFRGKYYAAPDCELRPRGPRPSGPPIMVAAFGPRMLRLTARHANSWNTAWLGQPAALDAPLAALREACAAEGRDPATLEISVGVTIAYPPAATPEGQPPDPARVITGEIDQVVEALRGYEERGVAHIICSPSEVSEQSLDWLAECIRQYRA